MRPSKTKEKTGIDKASLESLHAGGANQKLSLPQDPNDWN